MRRAVFQRRPQKGRWRGDLGEGEISCNVAAKAYGVVLMDRAGWHSTDKLKVPKNLTIILLPSRSPELNPVENIWQY